jgi:hypothetical protein
MSEVSPETPPRRAGLLHHLLYHPLALTPETSLFILLSALDVLMTSLLLYGNKAREFNPVANYVLHEFGLDGLLAFKLCMVFFVILVAQGIARRRLSLARWVLNFGSTVLAIVVLYSAAIYFFT